MNEKVAILNIFNRIADAYAECGPQNYHKDLAQFIGELESGVFFDKPEKDQFGTLDWYEEAYLGRGECIWGLIDRGCLPKEFADDMQIAIWRYYLSLDISEETKEWLNRKLAACLAK